MQNFAISFSTPPSPFTPSFFPEGHSKQTNKPKHSSATKKKKIRCFRNLVFCYGSRLDLRAAEKNSCGRIKVPKCRLCTSSTDLRKTPKARLPPHPLRQGVTAPPHSNGTDQPLRSLSLSELRLTACRKIKDFAPAIPQVWARILTYVGSKINYSVLLELSAELAVTYQPSHDSPLHRPAVTPPHVHRRRRRSLVRLN